MAIQCTPENREHRRRTCPTFQIFNETTFGDFAAPARSRRGLFQIAIDCGIRRSRGQRWGKKDRSRAAYPPQRSLRAALGCYPTTAGGAQFCLLCCQPGPVPESLPARPPSLTQGRPCRPPVWSGHPIHTASRTCDGPQRFISQVPMRGTGRHDPPQRRLGSAARVAPVWRNAIFFPARRLSQNSFFPAAPCPPLVGSSFWSPLSGDVPRAWESSRDGPAVPRSALLGPAAGKAGPAGGGLLSVSPACRRQGSNQ